MRYSLYNVAVARAYRYTHRRSNLLQKLLATASLRQDTRNHLLRASNPGSDHPSLYLGICLRVRFSSVLFP